METDFETLIAGFITNRVGISEHFLSEGLALHLKQNLLTLIEENMLKAAGTGNADKAVFDAEIRSDSIYWLDRAHGNEYENAFFDKMDAFVVYLNESCFTGISSYEFHYSLYSAGSFYKKHLDQFKNNNGRQYSVISYLNENWQEKDGGQLLIHQKGGSQKISPTQGKTVFFKSDELVHEVLISQQNRMSISGWLK